MSRLDDIFAHGRPVLMPFLAAGHPTLEATEQAILRLESAGAGIVEIGVPFSDPIADGPVIAAAMHDALERGVTTDAVLDVVRRVRDHTTIGIVLMVSVSIVNRRGLERFVSEAQAAGVDGLIVPDIDLDDAKDLATLVDRAGLGFAMLVAPTTTPERIAILTQLSRGFVYLVARLGITGEQSGAPDIEGTVAAVRAVTDLPIAAGFGISQPDHVAAAARHANGVIVGSALVRRMTEAEDPVAAAADLVRTLAGGLGAGTNATRSE